MKNNNSYFEKEENSNNIKKISHLAVFLSLAVIMGYLEALIPFDLGIPGIKLGLANLVIVMILYLYGVKEAFLITVLRVVLIGFLFMNLSMLLYSLVGTIFAIVIMIIIKKTDLFSVIGVSIAGGIFHNLGQILVAYFVLKSDALLGYLPWLLLSGMIAGWFIGFLVKISYPFVKKIKN